MEFGTEDTPEYGPAMQALSPRMRSFVLALLDQRKRNYAAAARRAGYADPGHGATIRVQGHMLAHDPRIIAALNEEAGKRMYVASHIAAEVIVGVLADRKATNKDRLKAAALVLDRTGFGAAQTINVNKTVTDRTGAGMLERIKALALANGMDPVKLLGGNAVVDGEFSEVPDAE